MNKLLQVYGKNAGAQEIVQTELTTAFPSLVEQFDMVNRIYEKFYDWMFPFVYTEDGGADMTWRANVRAWIAKNPKLAELEAHFAQGTLSGTLTEKIDDTDNTTFTDNRATKQSTTFKGVDTTGSGALADSVTNEFETGKNATKDERTYNRTRTYADGRNWVQVMQDVQKAEEPVYTFINSFARLLVSPTWCKQDFCEVLPPSVEMSVEAESLPAGSTATAEIVNRGTPFNADWLLSLGIPPGPAGATKYCHNVNILTMNNTAISITLVNERSKPYNNIFQLQPAIFEAVGSTRAQTRFIPANGWLDNNSEVRGLYIQQTGGSATIMCLTGYNSGVRLGSDSVLSVYDTIT